MISPASMKNGTAISGKLSAPLMIFCATICESKMSSECISATPQTIRAKAIGIPSAMAPSRETVKTAMVMSGSEFLRGAVWSVSRLRRIGKRSRSPYVAAFPHRKTGAHFSGKCLSVLVTLPDSDQVIPGCPPAEDPNRVIEQDHRRGDAEYQPRRVEEEAYGETRCRRAVSEGE